MVGMTWDYEGMVGMTENSFRLRMIGMDDLGFGIMKNGGDGWG